MDDPCEHDWQDVPLTEHQEHIIRGLGLKHDEVCFRDSACLACGLIDLALTNFLDQECMIHRDEQFRIKLAQDMIKRAQET